MLGGIHANCKVLSHQKNKLKKDTKASVMIEA